MADPVTLAILVAAGEAMTPGTAAMAQGASEAFAGTTAELHETPRVPTDADATAIEAESHPDAVAELQWRDVDHRHATLRVHLRRSGRWIERSFVFGASDPATERGRMLGFALAAFLEVAATGNTSTPSPASGTVPGNGPAATTGSAPVTATGPSQATAPAGAPTATSPSSRPAAASMRTPAPSATTGTEVDMDDGTARDTSHPPRLGVDLLGAASTGIPGSASAGGGGALEWFVHPPFSLRLGALVRAGTLDVAEAHTATVVSSAGVVLHPWRTTRSMPFGVRLRVDYLLVRESATHFDADDPRPVTAARWISGVDTFLDGELLLSSQIAAVLGAGLEDVWAPTYVYVHDVQVARLPVLRAVAEAGFQLRF
jgi:hypothetical protein